MKIVAPDYYSLFRCLQGECRHTCCAGWEIEIDDDSLKRYRQIIGPFGDRLKESIVITPDETACFCLDQYERCPFLNKDGLCDMILTLGEESLCQICTDHPRFRNYFSDRIEVGLGLCCEAAAEIILKRKEPVSLVVISDDGNDEPVSDDERDFMHLRHQIWQMIQNRSISISVRLERLLSMAKCHSKYLEVIDWIDFLLALELLEDAWAERLRSLKSTNDLSNRLFLTEEWENAWEQLLVYLIFRHLPSSLEDGDWELRIVYCVFVCKLIFSLCVSQAERAGSASLDDLAEIARLYSSEIEYSDENLDAILNHIRLTTRLD